MTLVFKDKPKTAYEALSRIIQLLKLYFDLPTDEIYLQVIKDKIIGYILSNKLYGLTEEGRLILLRNLLNNYSYEYDYIGFIKLLSLEEKDFAEDFKSVI